MILLHSSGGGKSSDLRCNGDINQGSDQMDNLTKVLQMCEKDIKTSCNSSNLPAWNTTADTECTKAISSFKNGMKKCLKLEGAAACSCWASSTLSTTATTIKACDCQYRVDTCEYFSPNV